VEYVEGEVPLRGGVVWGGGSAVDGGTMKQKLEIVAPSFKVIGALTPAAPVSRASAYK